MLRPLSGVVEFRRWGALRVLIHLAQAQRLEPSENAESRAHGRLLANIQRCDVAVRAGCLGTGGPCVLASG
jgi:hypothetical protein